MACYPNKDKRGTSWSVEGHVNDRGMLMLFVPVAIRCHHLNYSQLRVTIFIFD